MPQNDLIKKQFQLFTSKEELLKEAVNFGNIANTPFKISTKYYFIARYFVSVYESRFGEIPIQVWNEYRNALDHFFRNETSQPEETVSDDIPKHIHRMEGHILRAALDILKMYCHKVIDDLKNQKNGYKREVLVLVDNGKYLENVTTELESAIELFTVAKTQDLQLSNDEHDCHEVLENYLKAAFKCDELLKYTRDKESAINQAIMAHRAISDNASNHSTWHHIKTHFYFYVLWGTGATLLVYFGSTDFFKSYIEQPILTFINSLF